MAIKIPLIMADGARVKTLEELREHFDLVSVLSCCKDGRLEKWLRSGYYDEEADRIAALDQTLDGFQKELCEILGVYYSESTSDQKKLDNAMKKRERLDRLKLYTADDDVLAAVDCVAFTQEELADLLDKDTKKIYLCGERFAVPEIGGITYIGINDPEVYIPYEFGLKAIRCEDVDWHIGSFDFDEKRDVYSYDAWALNISLKCRTESTICRVKRFRSEDPTALWQKAAEQGSAVAELAIGDIFYAICNEHEAYDWYLKAAEHGNPLAQFYIGALYYSSKWYGDRNFEKAFEWFSKAAEKGLADAQFYVGRCYYYDYGYGVEENNDQAFKWFTKAAEQIDDDRVQFYVGRCYYYGHGVEKDSGKAFEWFSKSAEQGNDRAQFYIGRCYYYGHGIRENDDQAFEWFTKAANQGNIKAQEMLKELSDRQLEHTRIKDCIRKLLKCCLGKHTSIDYNVSNFSYTKLRTLMFEMTQRGESVDDVIALYDPSVVNVCTNAASGILFTIKGFYFRRTPTSSLYYMEYTDIAYAEQSEKIFDARLNIYGNCIKNGNTAYCVKMKGISYDQSDVKELFEVLGEAARRNWPEIDF